MSKTQGRFVWYELMTTDTEGAKAFYKAVVGWDVQDMPMPGMTYTILSIGGTQVAGLMARPEMAKNTPPAWFGYVAVDDVDASAEQAKKLGGQVHVPPTDIPNVGRFSMIADPQGAVISLFKAPQQPEEYPMSAPARVGWHELMSADASKGFDFYSKMFGWVKSDAMDMGPMGTYQMFKRDGAEFATGGMMNKPKEVPASFWSYYFTVPSIDAAIGRLTKAGGKVINGPMEVPGSMWIVQGMDPQGAMFSLLGPKS